MKPRASIVVCHLMVALLAGVSFIGCEEAKKAANNISNEPGLNGVFTGPCKKNEVLGVAVQTEYYFAGHLFERRTKFFNEDNCDSKDPGGVFVAKGEYSLVDPKEKDAKADPSLKVPNKTTKDKDKPGFLSLEIKELELEAKDQNVVDALNTVQFCGASAEYQVGTKTNITQGNDDRLCPFSTLPSKVYGSYFLEKDKLLLNNGGLSEMSDQESDRPNSVDETVVYERTRGVVI